jgi:uncharacterized surface protein with fasciclin (FAS1) repeats
LRRYLVLGKTYQMRKGGIIVARISEIVSATRTLRTLSDAFVVSGVDMTVDSDGPYTLFAPNEDAFSELGSQALIALAADPENLASKLRFHLIPGRYTLRELGNLGTLPNCADSSLYVSIGEDGDTYVEEARIVDADIAAENGIIHIVDLVILPLESAIAALDDVDGPDERDYLPSLRTVSSNPFFDQESGTEEFAGESWAV